VDSASPNPVRIELLACAEDPGYFLNHYVFIYHATLGEWIPFRLWNAQLTTLDTIRDNLLVVILKARQLGLSWLVLGFALWLMLFHPAATVLLFSRRDDEAVDLLKNRLRGMYDRLPAWLKVRSFPVDNDHEWQWSNGSRVLAFPTTAGDSYTATLAIVDEADLVPDLDSLMRAVKPTIDGGGRMILLSRADKSTPQSPFKRIYLAATQGQTNWAPAFLPWHARPDRDAAWYEAQRRDILARTGAVDDLAEQYPETDAEALAPRSLDKRLPLDWLKKCHRPQAPLSLHKESGAPALPGLLVYALPVPGRDYVLGADPAEGNPTSDESACSVGDLLTGEEVAVLGGRFEPATFANYIHELATWYGASAMIERNNHGHAVLLWLRDNGKNMPLLAGLDGVDGWNTNSKSKASMYSTVGETLRDGETVIHNLETFEQLASIEGSTLAAPKGQHDDRATAYALMIVGREVLLMRQVDVHKLFDEWIAAKRGSAVSTQLGDLPANDRGSIDWIAAHEEYYVSIRTGAGKRYVFNCRAARIEEALFAAVVAGIIDQEPAECSTIPEQRRAEIRTAVERKLAA
jgi:hypothetical protein